MEFTTYMFPRRRDAWLAWHQSTRSRRMPCGVWGTSKGRARRREQWSVTTQAPPPLLWSMRSAGKSGSLSSLTPPLHWNSSLAPVVREFSLSLNPNSAKNALSVYCCYPIRGVGELVLQDPSSLPTPWYILSLPLAGSRLCYYSYA